MTEWIAHLDLGELLDGAEAVDYNGYMLVSLERKTNR
jgi:hypothetical protein